MKTWSADLRDAHPLLQGVVPLVQAEFSERRAPEFLRITRVWGSQLVQDALWAQGRSHLVNVNALRSRVGLPPITAKENEHQVTWTRQSMHTRTPSLAVDFVVSFDPDGPGPLKPVITYDDEPAYLALGVIAERHGLVWGGRFPRYDGAHVQLPKDLSGVFLRAA